MTRLDRSALLASVVALAIPQVLRVLVNQSLQPGGSTDATAATLDKLAARVPRLRVLTHEARRGFGACLRTAAAPARVGNVGCAYHPQSGWDPGAPRSRCRRAPDGRSTSDSRGGPRRR